MAQESKYKNLSAPEAWTQFAEALSDVLAELEEDQFLILVAKSTDHFVQFAALGEDGMIIEAQSNAFIEKDNLKLSKEQQEQLLALGWNEPTYEPSEEEEDDENAPDGSPNYHIGFETPVSYATLASLTIETLQQIYSVRHSDDLKYSAFSYEGDSLHFPNLGIKRGRD